MDRKKNEYSYDDNKILNKNTRNFSRKEDYNLLDTNEAIYRQYETLGISKEVLDFGTSVEKGA